MIGISLPDNATASEEFKEGAVVVTADDLADRERHRVSAEIAAEERRELFLAEQARRRPVHFDDFTDAEQRSTLVELEALIASHDVPRPAARTMAITLTEDVFTVAGVHVLRVQVPGAFDGDPEKNERELYLHREPKLFPLAEGVTATLADEGPVAEYQRRTARWDELQKQRAIDEAEYARRLARIRARNEQIAFRRQRWSGMRETRALFGLASRLRDAGTTKLSAPELIETLAVALANEPSSSTVDPPERAALALGWGPLVGVGEE